jgi:hypothetical protein
MGRRQDRPSDEVGDGSGGKRRFILSGSLMKLCNYSRKVRHFCRSHYHPRYSVKADPGSLEKKIVPYRFSSLVFSIYRGSNGLNGWEPHKARWVDFQTPRRSGWESRLID